MCKINLKINFLGTDRHMFCELKYCPKHLYQNVTFVSLGKQKHLYYRVSKINLNC